MVRRVAWGGEAVNLLELVEDAVQHQLDLSVFLCLRRHVGLHVPALALVRGIAYA